MEKKTIKKEETELEKAEKKYEKPKMVKLEAIKTTTYERYNEIEKITTDKNQVNGWIIAGSIIETNDEIAKDLEEKQLAVRIDE